jgi:quercetin dioxygenase-like cupin family protein
MKYGRALIVAGFVLGTLLVVSAIVSAQTPKPDANGFLIVRPGEVQPPKGKNSINIIGNPKDPGFYMYQITWAPNTGSHPHFHDKDRYIHVIKGTWYVSTGPAADVYNPAKMTAVEPGSFIFEPANGHHYDMAKDQEVIVQIMGMGPVKTTQIPQAGDKGQVSENHH